MSEPDISEEAQGDDFTLHASDKAQNLIIDIDGFEGPLDLLLTLSRKHKLDLSKISILPLVEQYLAFIHQAKDLKLDVAADYLVMAAWLAFLKSKLLLPPEESEEEELSGDELAALLAHRLKRLEAMRKAGKLLLERNQLGIDVFECGAPEGLGRIVSDAKPDYDTTLYELLKAYARQREVHAVKIVTVKKRKVWSLKEARGKLEKILQMNCEWAAIDHYLFEYLSDPAERRTALAAGFGASLELVKEGFADIRQEGSYSPIYLRSRESEE